VKGDVKMLIDFKQKSQVTIPKSLVEKLKLRIGDKLDIEEKDGKLVITPVMIIPKDQAWYYSEKWQQMEKEVDEQIARGEVHSANNADELFEGLGLDEE
jgi:antitoxin MazE